MKDFIYPKVKCVVQQVAKDSKYLGQQMDLFTKVRKLHQDGKYYLHDVTDHIGPIDVPELSDFVTRFNFMVYLVTNTDYPGECTVDENQESEQDRLKKIFLI